MSKRLCETWSIMLLNFWISKEGYFMDWRNRDDAVRLVEDRNWSFLISARVSPRSWFLGHMHTLFSCIHWFLTHHFQSWKLWNKIASWDITKTVPYMLHLKGSPYTHSGENHHISGHLVLKMQKSCFPFRPLGGGAWEHWRKEDRWAEDQEGFSKLLKLPSYCRKLTVHGHNENIKNVAIISPVCFVLHIVELHMKLQPWVQIANVWQEEKVVSTSGYCPLQQANPFRC